MEDAEEKVCLPRGGQDRLYPVAAYPSCAIGRGETEGLGDGLRSRAGSQNR